MRSPDPKDVAPAAAVTKEAAVSVEEIRVLEAKILGMKKELLFSAAAVDDGAASLSLNFLLVRVEEGLFAAPISQVDEVVELPALAPLGDAVKTIAGLCNYHGQMIAVVDVAELSGGSRTEISVDRVLVICTVKPRTFALLVDEAFEVVTSEPGAVTLADEVMSGVLRSAGVLRLAGNATAQIIDLAWIAVGAQLAALLSSDAATPAKERGA
jgi:chemotaxis signal transduction protein